jgi:hypothetical protein
MLVCSMARLRCPGPWLKCCSNVNHIPSTCSHPSCISGDWSLYLQLNFANHTSHPEQGLMHICKSFPEPRRYRYSCLQFTVPTRGNSVHLRYYSMQGNRQSHLVFLNSSRPPNGSTFREPEYEPHVRDRDLLQHLLSFNAGFSKLTSASRTLDRSRACLSDEIVTVPTSWQTPRLHSRGPTSMT